jgi:beta-lactamase class D
MRLRSVDVKATVDRTLARKFGSKSSYSRFDNILELKKREKSKTGYTRESEADKPINIGWWLGWGESKIKSHG